MRFMPLANRRAVSRLRPCTNAARLLIPFAATLLFAACGRSQAPLSTTAVNAGDGVARCGDITERPWCDTSLDPQQRADLLLARMTLQQKISLMAGEDGAEGEATGKSEGIPELGIPTLYMSDGPMGPREGAATAMPAPITLGASFDPDLARRNAQVIGTEVKYKGNDLVHAPAVDVMRNPLGGRVFESYGEDPLLSSRLGTAWVRSVQAEGVISNVKHYAVNTQEGQLGAPPFVSVIGSRFTVDAVLDERTMREIYLPPFEAAVVEGGAGSVMCAYNRINGAPACANTFLLGQVLRSDWGFDGFVVSDYIAALKDTAGSANNGTDIEMPNAMFYRPQLLELAIISGQVSEATIDLRVGNILRTLFRFGFFDRAAYPTDDSLIDTEGHQQLARETAEQGMVLLRNNGLLPLDAARTPSIAVIGAPATQLINGGGSSTVKPRRFKSALDALRERTPNVSYDDGTLAESAARVAAAADIAIVFAADGSTEGTDKRCLSLDCAAVDVIGTVYCWMLNGAGSPLCRSPLPNIGQDRLIETVAAANPNTLVVLNVAGPVLTPWRDDLAALLVSWYAGQEGGDALARVLFGDTDPGGRLPVTFPAAELDTPVAGNPLQYPGVAEHTEYREGVFVGYRWYDQNAVTPAFAFGEGLSYSAYDFSGLQFSQAHPGTLAVQLSARNSGSRGGWVVPQVYLSLPAPSPDIPQPPKALKGFDKRWLAAGASAVSTITLNRRAFEYWDAAAGGWRIQPGCYRLMAGSSSRTLPLSAMFWMDADGTMRRDASECVTPGA